MPFGVVADFNGDGLDDVATWDFGLSNGRARIGVRLSTGTGFGPEQVWLSGSNMSPLAFGGTTANLVGYFE